MRERPPLTILDANAWLDCFRRADAGHVRSRVMREVRAGRLRPALVVIVVAELARGHHPDVAIPREVVLRFAWNASGGRLVLRGDVRERMELRARRPLREPELMSEARDFRVQHMMSLDFAVKMDGALREAHQEQKRDERRRHTETLEALTREQLDDVLGTHAARADLIASWAADDMAEAGAEIGLVADDLPRPEKCPAFRAAKAVHVERITRVLLEGRSRVHPGAADVALLTDALACGRAILVTRDEPLLELAERARAHFPRFAAVDAREWFARMLA